eukprot:GDKJ01049332.1.p1 GENE.GDKJ01049332.1~~GDKJ01049332.1.p1  ORF type:complete len:604 (-),score=72.91 GDKJ01049332.1:498-2138(-)
MYIHLLRKFKNILTKCILSWILVAFASFTGTYNLFEGGHFPSRFICFLICVALNTPSSIFGPLMDHHITSKFRFFESKTAIFRVIAFPSTWTFCWFLVTKFSPTGTYGLWSYSQADTTFGRTLVSVVGPYGVEFIIAAFGTAVSDVITYHQRPSDKLHRYLTFSSFAYLGGLLAICYFGTLWDVFSQTGIAGQVIHQVPNAAGIGGLHVTCASDNSAAAFDHLAHRIAHQPEYGIERLYANWARKNLNVGLSPPKELEAHLHPVNLVLFSEGQGTDELYSEIAKFYDQSPAHSRTIIMMTNAKKVQGEKKFRNEAVLFAPWTSKGDKLHPSIDDHLDKLTKNLPIQPALSERKRHGVPMVEHLKESTPAGGFISIPEEFKGLGSFLTISICFDLDNQDSWRAFGGKSGVLLLNPAGTWGPLGFRKYHAARQRFIADATGMNLVRCTRDGESTIYSPNGVGKYASALTAEGDIWTTSVEQPALRLANSSTFFGFLIMSWYGDIAIITILMLLSLIAPWKIEAQKKFEDLELLGNSQNTSNLNNGFLG